MEFPTPKLIISQSLFNYEFPQLHANAPQLPENTAIPCEIIENPQQILNKNPEIPFKFQENPSFFPLFLDPSLKTLKPEAFRAISCQILEKTAEKLQIIAILGFKAHIRLYFQGKNAKLDISEENPHNIYLFQSNKRQIFLVFWGFVEEFRSVPREFLEICTNFLCLSEEIAPLKESFLTKSCESREIVESFTVYRFFQGESPLEHLKTQPKPCVFEENRGVDSVFSRYLQESLEFSTKTYGFLKENRPIIVQRYKNSAKIEKSSKIFKKTLQIDEFLDFFRRFQPKTLFYECKTLKDLKILFRILQRCGKSEEIQLKIEKILIKEAESKLLAFFQHIEVWKFFEFSEEERFFINFSLDKPEIHKKISDLINENDKKEYEAAKKRLLQEYIPFRFLYNLNNYENELKCSVMLPLKDAFERFFALFFDKIRNEFCDVCEKRMKKGELLNFLLDFHCFFCEKVQPDHAKNANIAKVRDILQKEIVNEISIGKEGACDLFLDMSLDENTKEITVFFEISSDFEDFVKIHEFFLNESNEISIRNALFRGINGNDKLSLVNISGNCSRNSQFNEISLQNNEDFQGFSSDFTKENRVCYSFSSDEDNSIYTIEYNAKESGFLLINQDSGIQRYNFLQYPENQANTVKFQHFLIDEKLFLLILEEKNDQISYLPILPRNFRKNQRNIDYFADGEINTDFILESINEKTVEKADFLANLSNYYQISLQNFLEENFFEELAFLYANRKIYVKLSLNFAENSLNTTIVRFFTRNTVLIIELSANVLYDQMNLLTFSSYIPIVDCIELKNFAENDRIFFEKLKVSSLNVFKNITVLFSNPFHLNAYESFCEEFREIFKKIVKNETELNYEESCFYNFYEFLVTMKMIGSTKILDNFKESRREKSKKFLFKQIEDSLKKSFFYEKLNKTYRITIVNNDKNPIRLEHTNFFCYNPAKTKNDNLKDSFFLLRECFENQFLNEKINLFSSQQEFTLYFQRYIECYFGEKVKDFRNNYEKLKEKFKKLADVSVQTIENPINSIIIKEELYKEQRILKSIKKNLESLYSLENSIKASEQTFHEFIGQISFVLNYYGERITHSIDMLSKQRNLLKNNKIPLGEVREKFDSFNLIDFKSKIDGVKCDLFEKISNLTKKISENQLKEKKHQKIQLKKCYDDLITQRDELRNNLVNFIVDNAKKHLFQLEYLADTEKKQLVNANTLEEIENIYEIIKNSQDYFGEWLLLERAFVLIEKNRFFPNKQDFLTEINENLIGLRIELDEMRSNNEESIANIVKIIETIENLQRKENIYNLRLKVFNSAIFANNPELQLKLIDIHKKTSEIDVNLLDEQIQLNLSAISRLIAKKQIITLPENDYFFPNAQAKSEFLLKIDLKIASYREKSDYFHETKGILMKSLESGVEDKPMNRLNSSQISNAFFTTADLLNFDVQKAKFSLDLLKTEEESMEKRKREFLNKSIDRNSAYKGLEGKLENISTEKEKLLSQIDCFFHQKLVLQLVDLKNKINDNSTTLQELLQIFEFDHRYLFCEEDLNKKIAILQLCLGKIAEICQNDEELNKKARFFQRKIEMEKFYFKAMKNLQIKRNFSNLKGNENNLRDNLSAERKTLDNLSKPEDLKHLNNEFSRLLLYLKHSKFDIFFENHEKYDIKSQFLLCIESFDGENLSNIEVYKAFLQEKLDVFKRFVGVCEEIENTSKEIVNLEGILSTTCSEEKEKLFIFINDSNLYKAFEKTKEIIEENLNISEEIGKMYGLSLAFVTEIKSLKLNDPLFSEEINTLRKYKEISYYSDVKIQDFFNDCNFMEEINFSHGDFVKKTAGFSFDLEGMNHEFIEKSLYEINFQSFEYDFFGNKIDDLLGFLIEIKEILQKQEFNPTDFDKFSKEKLYLIGETFTKINEFFDQKQRELNDFSNNFNGLEIYSQNYQEYLEKLIISLKNEVIYTKPDISMKIQEIHNIEKELSQKISNNWLKIAKKPVFTHQMQSSPPFIDDNFIENLDILFEKTLQSLSFSYKNYFFPCYHCADPLVLCKSPYISNEKCAFYCELCLKSNLFALCSKEKNHIGGHQCENSHQCSEKCSFQDGCCEIFINGYSRYQRKKNCVKLIPSFLAKHEGSHQCELENNEHFCPKLCQQCGNPCEKPLHLPKHPLCETTHGYMKNTLLKKPKNLFFLLKLQKNQKFLQQAIRNLLRKLGNNDEIFNGDGVLTCSENCELLGRGHQHFIPCNSLCKTYVHFYNHLQNNLENEMKFDSMKCKDYFNHHLGYTQPISDAKYEICGAFAKKKRSEGIYCQKAISHEGCHSFEENKEENYKKVIEFKEGFFVSNI